MAMVELVSPVWLGHNFAAASATSGGNTVTVNQKYGFIFQPPRNGTISKVAIRFGNSTINTAISLRIETATANPAAAGFSSPTGTLFHVNGTSTGTNPTTGNYLVDFTLAGNVPVTTDDWLSLTATVTSGQTSLFGSKYASPVEVVNDFARPYAVRWDGTAWSLQTIAVIPAFALKYNDIGYCPVAFSLADTFNFATPTTDVIANSITLPFNCRVAGIWYQGDPPVNSTFQTSMKAEIYQNTSLPNAVPYGASKVFNPGQAGSTLGVNRYFTMMLSTPVDILANVPYRYAIRQAFVTGTTRCRIHRYEMAASKSQVPLSDLKNTYGLGNNAEGYETSGNAWSLLPERVWQIGPVISHIDDGSGGIRLPMAMNGGYSA